MFMYAAASARTCCVAGLLGIALVVAGCDVFPVGLTTPLQPGIYIGEIGCDADIFAKNGELVDQQTYTEPVTFEISANGVPIVAGGEIRKNRTVSVSGTQITYTRVAATENGIVFHATTSSTGGEALSIATLEQDAATSMTYRIQEDLVRSDGSTTISVCQGVVQR